MTWFRSLRILETEKQRRKRINHERTLRRISSGQGISRWEQDYVLNPVYEQFLFEEYLEMGLF